MAARRWQRAQRASSPSATQTDRVDEHRSEAPGGGPDAQVVMSPLRLPPGDQLAAGSSLHRFQDICIAFIGWTAGFAWSCRVAPGVDEPRGPPQIRTRRFPPSGSSARNGS